MILSKNSVDLILQAAEIGHVLGVDGIILDNDKGLRGYNDVDGVVITSTGSVDFGPTSIGLARLSSLRQKATVMSKEETYTVETVDHPNKPNIVEKLIFNSGHMDFEFRCALPRTITDVDPKQLNITKLFNCDITDEDITLMMRAKRGMSGDFMTIQMVNGELQFRFSDDTGDILNIKADTELNKLGKDDLVSLTINTKKMFPIFKMAVHDGKFRLNILQKNIILLNINTLDVLVMPEV